MSELEIKRKEKFKINKNVSPETKMKKINFFEVKEQFYERYALLHSTHLKSFIPVSDKNDYFFIIKKRYIFLLEEAFHSDLSLMNTKSKLFWELRSIMEELLLWKETKKLVLSLAIQYRGHPDYLTFLTLIKQLKAERKKSLFSSFFPLLHIDH